MDEQNQGEVEETTPDMPEETSGKKQTGSLVGVIIIIVILIIGGLYFWGSKITPQIEDEAVPAAEDAAEIADPATEALGDVSESDELGDIEADLEMTDIDAIDIDANQVD
ncbi:MAG: hypothetical protein KAV41_00800 [Candidatus Pacebacteria bacterium]|nr:hypothetical protein [Candidatus Paceibacterota bacterium]